MIEEDKRFLFSLFFLRLTVFIVMLMWTIDKFINPDHAAGIFENFYSLPGLESTVINAIGIVELIILLLFLGGYKKIFSYGAVLLFHAVSTLASFNQYLSPFDGPNLLFFAAWPMLAACLTLFLLREHDRMFTLQ